MVFRDLRAFLECRQPFSMLFVVSDSWRWVRQPCRRDLETIRSSLGQKGAGGSLGLARGGAGDTVGWRDEGASTLCNRLIKRQQMEGNAMCHESPMQSFTAAQHGWDFKNRRLMARCGNVERGVNITNAELTNAQLLDAVAAAYPAGVRALSRRQCRPPARALWVSRLKKGNASNFNCLPRQRCLYSNTSSSPTVSCSPSRQVQHELTPVKGKASGISLQRAEQQEQGRTQNNGEIRWNFVLC